MASDPPRRCKAKAHRTGKGCMRAPIRGGQVCMMHGGAAPQVKRKAKERLLIAQAIKEFGLAAANDSDRVLAEIAAIAFLQVGDLYDENGQLLPVKQMPPYVQAAIGNPEVVQGNVDSSDGQRDKLVRFKIWDKPKMLEILAKHHGLADERVHVDAHVYTWEGEDK